MNFEIQIPGYEFEYVPTPLASGGVGMYIDNTLEYIVLGKCANDAFQALWIEIINRNKKNIICGIIYRQHNDPNRFINYLDETVEKFSLTGKSLCVMGDFNVDLFKSDTCNYAQNFLLSCHSYSLLPSIDKPSRIYNDWATLIDNILVNTLDHQIHSGNIISDISDHYSQFCIIHSVRNISKSTRGQKMRDFYKFSESKFMNEVREINWDSIVQKYHCNVNKLFSSFYNKLDKLVNKHAPRKRLTKRDIKKFSKPWITTEIKQSIKERNRLLSQGKHEEYKYYRNKIVTLIRASKKKYYLEYFESNLNNMKNTWAGINNLINKKRKNSCKITALKNDETGQIIREPSALPNVLNKYFASIGHKLGTNVTHPDIHFTDYLKDTQTRESFFCTHQK